MEAWIYGRRVRDIYNKYLFLLIRLYIFHSLIFFISLLFSCSHNEQKNHSQIIWKDKKAIGISFPIKYTEGSPIDSVAAFAEIRLISGNNPVAVFGDFSLTDQAVLFTPLIPFTRGLSYEIRFHGKYIDTFTIPKSGSSEAPALLGIFPSADTLPENLLKVYLHFSQPMREGQSAKFVSLLKNDSDTVKGAFLDLQPELWNPDRTILTLWLDPGRIKRDLIPNKLLGAPLTKNSDYQIVISKDWMDASGNFLNRTYSRKFVTSVRDSLSPDPHQWKISLPKKGTTDALTLDFHEPLDHSLLTETLSVKFKNGKTIPGKWQITNHERAGLFSPDQKWIPAKYVLNIETRLEDLAGNNLNRTFEKDITKKSQEKINGDFTEIMFEIKE